MVLRMNGAIVATSKLPDFIATDPNDSMQIGADLGSPVVKPPPPKFAGWIESVRIFSGDPASKRQSKAATKP